jgi:hypothetical protein
MPLLHGVLTPDNQVIPRFGKTVTISSAQLLTLNTVPVTLIPSPGPGMAITVIACVLSMNRTSVAYTGGGTVAPVYQGATGTPLTANQMAAADVTTGGAGQTARLLQGTTPAGGLGLLANTAVQLFAGTGNFAAGTGTMKVHISYNIVSL